VSQGVGIHFATAETNESPGGEWNGRIKALNLGKTRRRITSVDRKPGEGDEQLEATVRGRRGGSGRLGGGEGKTFPGCAIGTGRQPIGTSFPNRAKNWKGGGGLG